MEKRSVSSAFENNENIIVLNKVLKNVLFQEVFDMIIVKQMELRQNIKKYFDMVDKGEEIIIPRKENRNVVVISEEAYREYRKAKENDDYIRMLRESMEQAKTGKTVTASLEDLKKYEE